MPRNTSKYAIFHALGFWHGICYYIFARAIPPRATHKEHTMTTLTSPMLRGLVRDSIPGAEAYGAFDPFTESSHDDGCLHGTLDSVHDCFSVRVPLREYLAARFGCNESSIVLHWDAYTCRYSADVPVTLSSADRQRLEAYEE